MTIRPKVVPPPRPFWRIVLIVLVVFPLLPEIAILSVSEIADLSGCRVDAPPPDATTDTDSRPTGDAQVHPDRGDYATMPDRRPAIRSPQDAVDQAGPGARSAAKGSTPAPGSAFPPPGTVCLTGSAVSSGIRLALHAAFLVGDALSSGVVIIWLALCYVLISRGWTAFWARLTLALLVCLIFAFIPYFELMMSIGGLENQNCRPDDVAAGPCIIMYGVDVGSIVHQDVLLRLRVFVGAPLALGTFLLYLLFLLIARLVSRKTAGRSA